MLHSKLKLKKNVNESSKLFNVFESQNFWETETEEFQDIFPSLCSPFYMDIPSVFFPLSNFIQGSISLFSLFCWFCGVLRKKEDGAYQSTTWQINFSLDKANPGGTFMLRIALATANQSELQVQVVFDRAFIYST